jgi:hypothetical protein
MVVDGFVDGVNVVVDGFVGEFVFGFFFEFVVDGVVVSDCS